MAKIYPLKKPAPSTPADGTYQARVLSATDDGAGFLLANGARAQRAFSCLVEPRATDLVLVASVSDGDQTNSYILAVLERPGEQSAALCLPGGAELHSSRAGLSVHAETIELAGKSRVQLDTAQLQLNAVAANTNLKHWHAIIDNLEAQLGRIGYTASQLAANIGRVLVRATQSYRSVENLDELRAGRSKTTVRDFHQLRAGHISARAAGFVKIDGKKIDLG